MDSKKSVLVIDDDRVSGYATASILTHHGYTTFLAEGAAEGLNLALKERPALVILDIYMPFMDGWDVLARLKQDLRTKSIPVVMLTSADTIKSVDMAFDLGARDYLTKPVRGIRLLDKVRRILSAGKEISN